MRHISISLNLTTVWCLVYTMCLLFQKAWPMLPLYLPSQNLKGFLPFSQTTTHLESSPGTHETQDLSCPLLHFPSLPYLPSPPSSSITFCFLNSDFKICCGPFMTDWNDKTALFLWQQTLSVAIHHFGAQDLGPVKNTHSSEPTIFLSVFFLLLPINLLLGKCNQTIWSCSQAVCLNFHTSTGPWTVYAQPAIVTFCSSEQK